MFVATSTRTMANARPKTFEREVWRSVEQIRSERRAASEEEQNKREAERQMKAAIEAAKAERARREAKRREILERIENTMKRSREERVPIGERVPIREILRTLCEFHDVTIGELMSRRRTRFLMQVRHEAIRAVADARPDMSLPEIGRVFDGRDHTTILHSLRTTAKEGFDYRGRISDKGAER